MSPYGLEQFISGDLGSSPATQAAIEAWKVNALPILQQQAQLAGYGGSPALTASIGKSLATLGAPLAQNDLANRLQAAALMQDQERIGLEGQRVGFEGQRVGLEGQRVGLEGERVGQGWEGLSQSAMQLQAAIEDMYARQQIDASLAQSNIYGQQQAGLMGAADWTQRQQQMALQALYGGGQAQTDVAQGAMDSEADDWIRRQGLAENSTTGLFGGGFPLNQTTRTRNSGSVVCTYVLDRLGVPDAHPARAAVARMGEAIVARHGGAGRRILAVYRRTAGHVLAALPALPVRTQRAIEAHLAGALVAPWLDGSVTDADAPEIQRRFAEALERLADRLRVPLDAEARGVIAASVA